MTKRILPHEILKSMKKECQYKGYYFDKNRDKLCFNGFIANDIFPDLINNSGYERYEIGNKIFNGLLHVFENNKMLPDDVIRKLSHYNDSFDFDEGLPLAIKFLEGLGL